MSPSWKYIQIQNLVLYGPWVSQKDNEDSVVWKKREDLFFSFQVTTIYNYTVACVDMMVLIYVPVYKV